MFSQEQDPQERFMSALQAATESGYSPPDKDLPEYLYLPPEHLMLLK